MDPQKEEELSEIIETATKVADACKESYGYRLKLRLSRRQFGRIKEKYMWEQVDEDEYEVHATGDATPSEVESLLRKAEKLAKKLGKDIRPLVSRIRRQAYLGAMQREISRAKHCEKRGHDGAEYLIEAKCYARKAGLDTTSEIQELEESHGPNIFRNLVIGTLVMCLGASSVFTPIAMLMAFVLSGPYVQNHDFILWPLPLITFVIGALISLVLVATEFVPKYLILRKPIQSK